MLNRKETTQLLTDILIHDRLSDFKYFAKEVTLDWGTAHPKRVDVMQFCPGGTTFVSDIEKGTFICYEIKSCVDDVYSGSGLNFFGEQNYIVCTMQTYKDLTANPESQSKLVNYLIEHYPMSSTHFGFMVPVPWYINLQGMQHVYPEFENPSPFEGEASKWRLKTMMQCRPGVRTRSIVELLFCMFRSKHSYTNQI